jgi:Circularly permuted ATP-grasp type 2
VDGAGGKGLVIGPRAARETLVALREQVVADPRGWIAQPMVMLSTVPTLIDGQLRPRHVDLRPFAVNDGQEVFVLPGGLTRVALPEGELVVNSSQGGGSKDTWVLSGTTTGIHELPRAVAPSGPARIISMPLPDPGPAESEVRHQQQQQQQQRPGRPSGSAAPVGPEEVHGC